MARKNSSVGDPHVVADRNTKNTTPLTIDKTPAVKDAPKTPLQVEPVSKKINRPRQSTKRATEVHRAVETNETLDQEKREVTIFYLLLFFIGSFLIKVIFGIISDSEPLFISAIFALYGIFITVLHMLRVQGNDPTKRKEELELTIIAGSSLLIAITSGILLIAVIHVTFFHRLAPPFVIGALISALLATIDLTIMFWLKNNSKPLEETDFQKIMSLLKFDLILMALTFFTVITTQWGFYVLDNILAIGASIFILIYSINFMRSSYHGLMGAEIDQELISEISGHIKTAVPAMQINSIKLNSVNRVLEIVCMLRAAKAMKIAAAKEVVARIELTLKNKLTVPHEVHIGFEEA